MKISIQGVKLLKIVWYLHGPYIVQKQVFIFTSFKDEISRWSKKIVNLEKYNDNNIKYLDT